MKSRASLKSHPIHPILIGFPIAFYTGTLAAHMAGWITGNATWLYMATILNVAGIVSAVIAAVPGIIDYTYTVPPRSSAKKRAATHGLLNTIALVLFTGAWLYRRQADPNHYTLLAAEGLGMLLTLFAGWMGGTLVHRNQIGVDVRYANAGKWNEQYFDSDKGVLEIASAGELEVNSMKLLHLRGRRLVLARTEERYVAFDDWCPHKGGSLAGGALACGTVQCPWHGSQFDVLDGRCKEGPSKTGITTYPVFEKEGKVFLQL